jgi:methyltransferase
VTLPLALLLGWFAVQRGSELWLSARHARVLASRGAVEHGAWLYPAFVVVHALYATGLVGEHLRFHPEPGPLAPLWLALFVASQALRFWSMATLGPLWTARVWVLPGHPVAHGGPYRWMRHPSYVAVTVELFAGPLALGAWRTALVASALHLPLVIARARLENRLLGGGPETRGG